MFGLIICAWPAKQPFYERRTIKKVSNSTAVPRLATYYHQRGNRHSRTPKTMTRHLRPAARTSTHINACRLTKSWHLLTGVLRLQVPIPITTSQRKELNKKVKYHFCEKTKETFDNFMLNPRSKSSHYFIIQLSRHCRSPHPIPRTFCWDHDFGGVRLVSKMVGKCWRHKQVC